MDQQIGGAQSRRAFVRKGGTLAVAGALGMAIKGGVAAGPLSDNGIGQVAADGDAAIVEALIGLERIEGSLYRLAIGRFGLDEGTSGDRVLPGHGDILRLKQQEQGHLAALTYALLARGGVPAERVAAFDFGGDDAEPVGERPAAAGLLAGVEDEAGFLAVAGELERQVVAAYAGALVGLADPGLRAVAAGILAVEVRHAAYLDGRAGVSPLANAAVVPIAAGEIGRVAKALATG